MSPDEAFIGRLCRRCLGDCSNSRIPARTHLGHAAREISAKFVSLSMGDTEQLIHFIISAHRLRRDRYLRPAATEGMGYCTSCRGARSVYRLSMVISSLTIFEVSFPQRAPFCEIQMPANTSGSDVDAHLRIKNALGPNGQIITKTSEAWHQNASLFLRALAAQC
jgi:hypothetical protein